MPVGREPPKYIMLSGASLRGWVWDRVIPLLDGPVTTLDLPGAETPQERRLFSLETAVETLTARVKASAKDVILVGHSIGGMLAAGIAHGAPENVSAVVFIGSYLPPAGSAHISIVPFPLRGMLRAAFAFNRTGISAPVSALAKEYCSDLDEETTRIVLDRTCPEPPRLFTEVTKWEPRPPSGIDVTYVKLTRDQAVAPEVQDQMIAMLGEPRVFTLESGHLPMLSRPRELAAALNATAPTPHKAHAARHD